MLTEVTGAISADSLAAGAMDRLRSSVTGCSNVCNVLTTTKAAFKIRTTTIFVEHVCYMLNGYHVSLRRHRSVQRNSSFCHFYVCFVLMAVRLVSRPTEFSEGKYVHVEQKFVEMGDTELPDDDPVQCGSEFCVICNELATVQR